MAAKAHPQANAHRHVAHPTVIANGRTTVQTKTTDLNLTFKTLANHNLSRHSLPTLLYFLFYSRVVYFFTVFVNVKDISHRTFLNYSLPNYLFMVFVNRKRFQIYCLRSSGTFGFAPTLKANA